MPGSTPSAVHVVVGSDMLEGWDSRERVHSELAAQKRKMDSTTALGNDWPVGLPGLMTTNARLRIQDPGARDLGWGWQGGEWRVENGTRRVG
jgi:hypothetical protein